MNQVVLWLRVVAMLLAILIIQVGWVSVQLLTRPAAAQTPERREVVGVTFLRISEQIRRHAALDKSILRFEDPDIRGVVCYSPGGTDNISCIKR